MAQNRSFLISRLFGFAFRRDTEAKLSSPVPPNPNDGAVVLGAPNQFGYLGNAQAKLDGQLTEHQLITRYRDMALHPLVDWAINEITNECIVQDGEHLAVELDLTDCEQIPDEVKELLVQEFESVLRLLNWTNESYQLFRNYYTDGRLFYQILPHRNPEMGIKELRYIDPRQIRKFIEVDKKVDPATQIEYTDIVNEYFVYAPFGIDYSGTAVVPFGKNPIVNGVKLTKDSVAFVHSGIFDSTSSVILSYLHKAIRPMSQLKSMENSTLIYKVARAPERRVWRIPTGQMPEKQVAHYLEQIVAQYRTKTAFDAISGDVVDERKVMSIIDDIFIPVPSSGESVQVDTIPGGSGFDDTSTIDYFNKQLLRSLNVPPSRLEQDAVALFGNTGMVSRDERQFAKMIHRLRKQFSSLFDTLLSTQLRLKGIVQDESDMDYLLSNWKYKFASDNYYSEMSEATVYTSRMTLAAEAQGFVGKYVSNKWIKQHIFKMTDEEQQRMQAEIQEEMAKGEILPPPVIDPATGMQIDPMTGQPVGGPAPGQPVDPQEPVPGSETFPVDSGE
jgi:hypothetical protein